MTGRFDPQSLAAAFADANGQHWCTWWMRGRDGEPLVIACGDGAEIELVEAT